MVLSNPQGSPACKSLEFQGIHRFTQWLLSIFFKKSGSAITIVAIYVDDIYVTGDAYTEIENLKIFLHSEFKIKDLGSLHYFLGMKILWKDQGIIISQRKYTSDLLLEFNVSHLPPMSTIIKFVVESDAYMEDATLYRHLFYQLNYLTHTR